jgi:transcriptional regulator with XRE-family HTH domain
MTLASSIARLVGQRIRELRLDAELTQQKLAQRSRTHRPIISRIEHGVHVPDLWTLAERARALELDVVTVLLGVDWGEIDGAACAVLRAEPRLVDEVTHRTEEVWRRE